MSHLLSVPSLSGPLRRKKIGEQRIENIRREMQRLPSELSDYYRLTTYERAMGDLFGPIWKSRLYTDNGTYGLVREQGQEETV